LAGVFLAAELFSALGVKQGVLVQIGSAVFTAPGCFFFPETFFFGSLLLKLLV
jgi:hypothetical protein